MKRLLLLVLALAAVMVAAPPTALAQEDPAAEEQSPWYLGHCNLADDLLGDIPWIGEHARGTCEMGTQLAIPGAAPAAAAGAAVEFVGGYWDSQLGEATEALVDGWKDSITFMMSWWMTSGVAGPLQDNGGVAGPLQDNGVEPLTYQIHQYLRVIQIGVFLASVMVSLVVLAWSKPRMVAANAGETAKILTRSVFATWALTPIIMLADAVCRGLGSWLIERVVGDNIDGALDRMLGAAQYGTLGAGLVLVLALFGIAGTLVQAVFIIVQVSLARLVLGFAPIAAAASGLGQAGKQVWAKSISWLVVLVLFPLVTSVVYAIAFTAFSADDPTGQGVITGMILLTLSFVTLPVLARLIVPTMTGMAGGSAAPALTGAALATGAVAGAAMKSMGGASGGAKASSSGAAAGGRSEAPTGATPMPGGSMGPGQNGSAGRSGGAAGGGASGAASTAAMAHPAAGVAVAAGKAVGGAVRAAGEQTSNIADGGQPPSGSVSGGKSS